MVFGISVPEDKILAGVSQLRRLSLLIGLISVAVVSAMLLAVINRLVLRPLGGEPEVAAEIAHQVAQGDLTTLVRLQAGDRHSLMAALASMQQQLRQMVAEIRDSSEFVPTLPAKLPKGIWTYPNALKIRLLRWQKLPPASSVCMKQYG
jgi:methyl-accepting chemotaxis protein